MGNSFGFRRGLLKEWTSYKVRKRDNLGKSRPKKKVTLGVGRIGGILGSGVTS